MTRKCWLKHVDVVTILENAVDARLDRMKQQQRFAGPGLDVERVAPAGVDTVLGVGRHQTSSASSSLRT